MIPFEKCPICGGTVVQKEVDKILRGAANTAILKVNADVCQHCGERLYSQGDVRKFEQIRKKLKLSETADFKPIGQTFQVV